MKDQNESKVGQFDQFYGIDDFKLQTNETFGDKTHLITTIEDEEGNEECVVAGADAYGILWRARRMLKLSMGRYLKEFEDAMIEKYGPTDGAAQIEYYRATAPEVNIHDCVKQRKNV
jgi:hypothetical protein